MSYLDPADKEFLKANKVLLQRNDFESFWGNLLDLGDGGTVSRISQYMQECGINLIDYCKTEVFNGLYFRTELSEIIIPSRIRSIGVDSFGGCTKLTNIHIPSSVQRIETRGFEDCYDLRQVTFDEGLKYIGDLAFNNCEKLQSLKLPNSLEEIGEYAFDGFFDISYVYFPENLRRIGNQVFGRYIPQDLKILCGFDADDLKWIWPDFIYYADRIEFS